jgi:hypothetical protein
VEQLIGPTARLSLDDEGRVYAVEPETEESGGRIAVVGHVDDDRRCPSDRLGEWAALASRWREEVAEGRAERALRAAEYQAAIAGRWSEGWLGRGSMGD